MMGFLSLTALFIAILCAMIFVAGYLARNARCAKGEDHFVCFREWLKAATPLVALVAAFVAAVGGWIALQNLTEIQKNRLEQAASVERSRIAAIMGEKEAFIKVYRSDFLRMFVGELRRPMTTDMPVYKIKERLEGLTHFSAQEEAWLSSQYAVGATSSEVGKARHAFDKTTAGMVGALMSVIEIYSYNKYKDNADLIKSKSSDAVRFYENDFTRTCDAYWDALDTEMVRLHADVDNLDGRSLDR